jgi:hypothetical protein
MAEPLDELYIAWLYAQISNVNLRSSRRTHWALMSTLYTCEFVALVPNDDNRVEDIKDLKKEFLFDAEIPYAQPTWFEHCSFLELLIVLSRLLDFETDFGIEYCFWHLLENIGLSEYNDNKKFSEQEVEEIVDTVVSRNYDRNGRGGLFPLEKSRDDQREIDLWYQLNAYVIQNEQ